MGLSAQLERQEQLTLVSAPTPVARIPVWLYPQVLSLDAPLVAISWQWLFAKSFHVGLSPLVLCITAACVWIIYVTDHWLDVRSSLVCSARHRFVQKHARCIVLALLTMVCITGVAAMQLPSNIWLGGIVLAAVVGLYLLIVHLGGDTARRYWPKELVIGAVFAVGSSIATWAAGGIQHAWLEVALFAALCTLNCAAIDCWEWQLDRVLLRYPHRFTRWLARRLYLVAVLIAAIAGVAQFFAPNAAAIAVVMSALLLMIVGVTRSRVSSETARLLADAALLTPLLFLLR